MISSQLMNLINILDLLLNIQNLGLNEQQSKALFEEMSNNQDPMLKTIIQQNETLIEQNSELLRLLKQKS